MSCIECKSESKYKCPSCRQPYCSVACYKEHKQKPCSLPLLPQKDTNEVTKLNTEYDYPTEDTVPIERLRLLAGATEVQKCLANPHVREILELLDKSSHPDELIQDCMQEPIFTEFVDACLKVVQTEDENKCLTKTNS